MATKADYDTVITAWGVACRYLKNDCDGISPPPIAWVDRIRVNSTGIDGDSTFLGRGGYNERTRTIHLLTNISNDKIMGILIHEYVHHILHVSGITVIVRGDVKSVCESERMAHKISHRWMTLNNKRHQVIKWKKYYPDCR